MDLKAKESINRKRKAKSRENWSQKASITRQTKPIPKGNWYLRALDCLLQ